MVGSWRVVRREGRRVPPTNLPAARPHAVKNTFPRHLTSSLREEVRENRRGALTRGGGEFSMFYISNFLEDYCAQDLWRLFEKWGRVRDVFIHFKRNKYDRRFAF
ncbi:unnamed protein product [Lupinus luteus]|uniref:RRM domain-containing protein n=1 Tax=Lupinus luteus TaxID=3873 RepID=A0AAV1X6D7_LUPLU